jgi:hypothetical protein
MVLSIASHLGIEKNCVLICGTIFNFSDIFKQKKIGACI